MKKDEVPGIAERALKTTGPEGSLAVHWTLADEVPVSLTFNGVAHAVMMASPSDLEDYGVGFALAERILVDPGDLRSLEVRKLERGFLIDLQVGEDAGSRVAARRRNLPGQTSCGICGIIELEEALPELAPVTASLDVSHSAVRNALSSLRDHQPLNASARSLHGAAFCSAEGSILFAREDVGRHNALDKLIGAGVRAGVDLAAGFIVMSSRCSIELVQKVVIAGVPLLATASAPTTLAVKLAEDARLTLVCASGPQDIAVLVDPHCNLAQIDKQAERREKPL
jgi:FdhD protein